MARTPLKKSVSGTSPSTMRVRATHCNQVLQTERHGKNVEKTPTRLQGGTNAETRQLPRCGNRRALGMGATSARFGDHTSRHASPKINAKSRPITLQPKFPPQREPPQLWKMARHPAESDATTQREQRVLGSGLAQRRKPLV